MLLLVFIVDEQLPVAIAANGHCRKKCRASRPCDAVPGQAPLPSLLATALESLRERRATSTGGPRASLQLVTAPTCPRVAHSCGALNLREDLRQHVRVHPPRSYTVVHPVLVTLTMRDMHCGLITMFCGLVRFRRSLAAMHRRCAELGRAAD